MFQNSIASIDIDWWVPLWQESSKSIQIEAFHVFKVRIYSCNSIHQMLRLWPYKALQLFAANHNKPPDIVSILVANRSKLLRLFADFKTEKGTKTYHVMWNHASSLSLLAFILVCRGRTVWGWQSASCQRNRSPWTEGKQIKRSLRNARELDFRVVFWVVELCCMLA